MKHFCTSVVYFVSWKHQAQYIVLCTDRIVALRRHTSSNCLSCMVVSACPIYFLRLTTSGDTYPAGHMRMVLVGRILRFMTYEIFVIFRSDCSQERLNDSAEAQKLGKVKIIFEVV